MFEDNPKYQRLLGHVSKYQAYNVSNALSIPRMVIIGEQSSGKSSTLESITRLPFPHGVGTCTRFPIQVTLCRDPALRTRMLSASIKGQEEFNTRYSTPRPSADDFAPIIEFASQVLDTDKSQISVSNSVLEITLSGADVTPLILVDLPGFVETPKELQETIVNINMDFIKDENTIILAVVPATIDLNTSKAVRAAADHDPERKRTITIITHADGLASNHQKEFEWIGKILRQSEENPANPYLVLSNKRSRVGESPLSWEQAREAELDFFGRSEPWDRVPSKFRGREAVTRFLGEVLYKHLCDDLPRLTEAFETKLSEYRREEKLMGITFANANEARAVLPSAVTSLAKTVRNFLKGDYHLDYLDAHPALPGASHKNNPYFARGPLSRWYEDYRDAMLNEWRSMRQSDILPLIEVFKAGALPGLVDSPLFKNLLKAKFLNPWRKITHLHILSMHRYLADTVQYHIHRTARPEIRKLAVFMYRRFADGRRDKISKEIETIFLDETEPVAVNFRALEMYYGSNDQPATVIQDLAPSDNHTPELSSTTSQNHHMLDQTPDRRTPDQTPDRRAPDQTPDRHTPDQTPDRRMSAQTPSFSWDNGDSTPNPSRHRQQQQPTHSVYDERTAATLVPILNGYIKFICDPLVNTILKQTIQRHMILEHHDDEYYDALHHPTDAEVELHMMDTTRHSQREDIQREINILEEITAELSDIRLNS
ncbi:hypothetical protein DFQ26_008326 [Actinomortierella ambigua]|nr:hypothetical protein DFQ26_008326 [Actinomortierella ambigua]